MGVKLGLSPEGKNVPGAWEEIWTKGIGSKRRQEKTKNGKTTSVHLED
jgi:hypothetical protein